MKTLTQLTPDEFTQLLDGYYAQPMHRHNMTEAEVDALATRINKTQNIPLVSETGEQRILTKIVLRVDNFLYDNLPNELYELIRDADKGISDSEARKLIRRLTKLANTKLDIPYVPETVEKVIYRLIISTVINAARQGCVFEQEADDEKNLRFARSKK